MAKAETPPDAEFDTGDLRLFQVKVFGTRDRRGSNAHTAPEYRLYAASESHARNRGRWMGQCDGKDVERVEVLDEDVSDYGEVDA